MIGIIKSKAVSGFREEQVSDVDAMNCLLKHKDKASSFVSESRNIVSYANRLHKMSFCFSLYSNVYVEDYLDDKIVRDKGNGYYRAIQRMTFTKEYCSKDYGNNTQLSYYNPKYENQYLSNIYHYDMNNAFLSALKDGIYPLTDEGDLGLGMVEADQIGFNDIDGIITLIEEGLFARYRFKKGYSSKLKKWAVDKYNKRQLLKSQGDDIKAAQEKAAINRAIGILSNHNVFLRSYIVGKVYNYMNGLIDENTLIANTDAIISIGPRPDLNIGTKLGQFKIECENKIIHYTGCNYTIYEDMESKTKIVNKLRGISKGAQEGYNPETKTTFTPKTFERIGDQIYVKNNATAIYGGTSETEETL